MFEFIAIGLLYTNGDFYKWADSLNSRVIKLMGLLALVVEQ